MDFKLSVLGIMFCGDIYDIDLKFHVDNLFNFDIGLYFIFGQVTCPANFKRTNCRCQVLFVPTLTKLRLSVCFLSRMFSGVSATAVNFVVG